MSVIPFPTALPTPSRAPARVVRMLSGARVRAMAQLDPEDAHAYSTAVARVAPHVEERLGPRVTANRVRSLSTGVVVLEPLWLSRRRFRAALTGWETRPPRALVLADVRACYASVTPRVVFDRLVLSGCHPAEAGAVTTLLERFAGDGVPGLPVGPPASGVLANAVLAAADGAVAACGAEHVRWVDDFVVAATSGVEAWCLLAVLREALGALGLALAGEKTRVIEEPGAIREALRGTGLSALLAGGAGYHRRSDAHPLSCLDGAHPLPPVDGGVGPGRRAARDAGGQR